MHAQTDIVGKLLLRNTAGGISLSDKDNFFGRHLRSVVLLAFCSAVAGLAIFAVHVSHIVGVGSYEKVPRITASTIIAMVTNEQAYRNWAADESISNTVRAERPVASTSRYAVTLVVDKSLPFPALCRLSFFDSRPESSRVMRHRFSVTYTESGWLTGLTPVPAISPFVNRRFFPAPAPTSTHNIRFGWLSKEIN